MFWWFQRGGKYLRYETRETNTGAFELRVISPDGARIVVAVVPTNEELAIARQTADLVG